MTRVGEDCSFRRYLRISKNGRSAILMEAEAGVAATPGHAMSDFIRIGSLLSAAGIHTPALYEAAPDDGFLLLEDCGDVSFKAAIETGADAGALYALAVDVLAAIRERVDCAGARLPAYYASHVHQGMRRVVDWYLPAVRGRPNPSGLADEFLAVWEEIEREAPPCPSGFLHIDFHAENLMWMPGRDGLARCAVLDFQGAMEGPLPYDLANLLEDARRDVPADLRAALLERCCTGMGRAEREAFARRYRILATQFHCRVAGQFIRLAVRDGKSRHLVHLPRLTRYLRDGMADPALRPLRDWFAAQGCDFSVAPAVDPDTVGALVGVDAF